MADPTRIRVFVLADVRLYRDGLEQVLRSSPTIEIVGKAPVSGTSPRSLIEARPDVVLVEAAVIRHGRVAQVISETAPGVRVVAFGVTDEDDDVLNCAEAGVAGCVSREATTDDLVSTLRSVARGEFPCSPRIAGLLVKRMSALAAKPRPAQPDQSLTRRETEILVHISEGLSNKEIASRLGIEVSTVKNHVHHILAKSGTARRSQAAARVRIAIPSAGASTEPTPDLVP